jgi:hypothetical protein
MAKDTTQDKNRIADDVQERLDLPGYEPYPPEDDIMRRGHRVEGNLDDGPITHERNPVTPPQPSPDAPATDDQPGRYDFTEEDLQALGPIDLSLDLGDDEQLKQRTQPVDFAARDLDIPGSELDDPAEFTGSEDEENNPYSLGGDAHSDLEEGRQ